MALRKSFTSHLASTLLLAVCWSGSATALDLPSLPDFKSFSLEGSYYGGAGFGSSSIEPAVNQSGFSVSDSVDGGVQLFLGRDITPRISLEAYMSQMGEAEVSNTFTGASGGVEYSSFGGSALLYLLGGSGAKSIANRTGFNLYGRLGFGKINNNGLGVDYNRSSSWSLSSGMGAEYNLRNGFGLRAEFQSFDSDARVVSLSVVKRFNVSRKEGRMSFNDRDKNLVFVEASSKDPRSMKDSDGDGVSDYSDDCSGTEADALVGANGCEFTSVLSGLTFGIGSAVVENTDALDDVVDALQRNSDINVSIQAHTDNRGKAAKNMALSRKRAESVVRYLAEDGGIELGRISAIGYGESRPLKSNATDAGRMANRRVEIRVTE